MVADPAEKLPPHLQPEYTVLPVAGQPNAFEVAGAIHRDEQCWYRVLLGGAQGPAACECRGFKFRGICAHLKAAAAFAERGKRAAADAAVQWFLSLDEQARRDLFK